MIVRSSGSRFFYSSCPYYLDEGEQLNDGKQIFQGSIPIRSSGISGVSSENLLVNPSVDNAG